MQDFIPRGTGNSRWMKSSIPTGTTWEEALAMLRAGTFPFDLNGINASGIAQQGTPLNKANLLTDSVASKYGKSSSAVISQIFDLLSGAAIYKSGSGLKTVKGGSITIPASQISGKVQIVTGSYKGTGTYGSDNPNSLTFSGKIVAIFWGVAEQNNGAYLKTEGFIITSGFTPGADYISAVGPSSMNEGYAYSKLSADQRTYTWYNTRTADSQLNNEVYTYHYTAILI